MTGKMARRDQDCVEAQIMPGELGVSGEEGLGGIADAPLLADPDGFGGLGEAGSRLYLDEDQGAAPAGDEIDLADRRAIVAGEYAVSREAQAPGSKVLGPAAPALRLMAAAHDMERASARA